MSPEQWGNASTVGPASDLYALAVVAFEGLTGRRPFEGGTMTAYGELHRHGKVPALGKSFPPALDRMFQRALAKRPEDRHGSALELAAELRAALRTQPREQLKSAAQHWKDRACSPALLLRGDVLADLERSTTTAGLGELERSFVADSQRRARRVRWARRSLVAIAAMIAFGVYRAAMQTRLAQELTEVTVTQAELEQGRSALLHNEPEAQVHLAEAYKRDRSPSTAFMLARALQPRLAEQARFASSAGRMWDATFSADGHQLVTTDVSAPRCGTRRRAGSCSRSPMATPSTRPCTAPTAPGSSPPGETAPSGSGTRRPERWCAS